MDKQPLRVQDKEFRIDRNAEKAEKRSSYKCEPAYRRDHVL